MKKYLADVLHRKLKFTFADNAYHIQNIICCICVVFSKSKFHLTKTISILEEDKINYDRRPL